MDKKCEECKRFVECNNVGKICQDFSPSNKTLTIDEFEDYVLKVYEKHKNETIEYPYIYEDEYGIDVVLKPGTWNGKWIGKGVGSSLATLYVGCQDEKEIFGFCVLYPSCKRNKDKENKPNDELFLYVLYQDDNMGYETYDSVVVAAHSEEEARKIHPRFGIPNGDDYDKKSWEKDHSWCRSPELVSVRCIGKSTLDGQKPGIIIASYHSG